MPIQAMATSSAYPLFISNVGSSTSEEELDRLLLEFGGKGTRICRHTGGNSSRHAVAWFHRQEDATRALNNLNNSFLKGNTITMVIPESREKLFMGNLDPSVDDETLAETFKSWGGVR